MSTARTAPGKANRDLTPREFRGRAAGQGGTREAGQLDLSALKLDESFDADCDPYNNTGQYLVAAMKRRYED